MLALEHFNSKLADVDFTAATKFKELWVSRSLELYYIAKVLCPFESDFKFLTGGLYEKIEGGIRRCTAHLTTEKQAKHLGEAALESADTLRCIECLFRLLRARYLVDGVCGRYLQYGRNVEPISTLFESEAVLHAALSKSLELCKSVIALLCSSFKGSNRQSMEMDDFAYR